jgi:hypothetical protein
MKNKTTSVILAALALFTVTGLCQSPTPSPAPFDALGIYTPAPSATPASPTAAQIAAAQARFPNAAKSQLAALRTQIIGLYERTLGFFGTDATLTAAQKTAALSAADQTEISTLSWALYNLLTYSSTVDAKGNTIPVPPIPVVSGS